MESRVASRESLPPEACKIYHHDGNQLFPFVCGLCNLAFRNLHCFYTHFHEHHELMGGVFYHLCQFDHMKSRQDCDEHFGLNILSCNGCSQTFGTVCAAHKHLVECHKTKTYLVDVDKCTVFPQVQITKSKSVLDQNHSTHNKTDSGKQPTDNSDTLAGKCSKTVTQDRAGGTDTSEALTDDCQRITAQDSSDGSIETSVDLIAATAKRHENTVSETQLSIVSETLVDGHSEKEDDRDSEQVNSVESEKDHNKQLTECFEALDGSIQERPVSGVTEKQHSTCSVSVVTEDYENQNGRSSEMVVDGDSVKQQSICPVSLVNSGDSENQNSRLANGDSENQKARLVTGVSENQNARGSEILVNGDSGKQNNETEILESTRKSKTQDSKCLENQEKRDSLTGLKTSQEGAAAEKNDKVRKLNMGDCIEVDGWSCQFYETESDSEAESGSLVQLSLSPQSRDPKHQATIQDTNENVEEESVSGEVTINTILHDIEESQSSEDESEIDVDSGDDPTYKAKCDDTDETDTDPEEVDSTDSETLEIPSIRTKPRGKHRSKRHPCMFCKSHCTKISRHLATVHRNEDEVARILTLPKSSLERKRAWSLLLNKMIFASNAEAVNTGIGRKISKKCRNDYIHCKYCKGLYKKSSLYRHQLLCIKKPELMKFRPIFAGKLLVPCRNPYEGLEKHVLTKMKDDEIKEAIESDNAIILFGNKKYAEKGKPKNHANISKRMRELGLLLVAAKSTDPNILSLLDLMGTTNWTLFIESVKKVAEYKSESDQFHKPSLARRLGQSLRKCAKFEYYESFRKRNPEIQKLTETFVQKYRLHWARDVGEKADYDSKEKKNVKPSLVSLVEDVNQLNETLTSKAKSLAAEIVAEPLKCYPELAKVCLAQIILLNMERCRKVQRMKVKDYLDTKKGQADEVVTGKLSPFEKTLSGLHFTVEVNTSREFRVPILLTQEMYNSVTTLLKYREIVGVKDQDLLFARLNKSGHSYKGIDILLDSAKKCNLQHSTLFTGCKFRKQIETISQIISLKESNHAIVELFQHYDIAVTRLQTDNSLQIAKICKLIQSINNGTVGKCDFDSFKLQENEAVADETDDENDDDDSGNESQNEHNHNSGHSGLQKTSEDDQRLDRRKSPKRKHIEECGSPSTGNSEMDESAKRRKTNAQDIDGGGNDNLNSSRLTDPDGSCHTVAVQENGRIDSEPLQFQQNLRNAQGLKKRRVCVFCNSTYAKITRHVTNKHKKEEKVVKILAMPKNSIERKRAWQILFNKSDSPSNAMNKSCRTSISTCGFKSYRRNVKNFLQCPFCKGHFRKPFLWKHQQYCRSQNPGENARQGFQENVIRKMKEDEVKSTIVTDNVIMRYGNMKYEEDCDLPLKRCHLEKMRNLGRLVLTAKSEDPTVTCVSDLFDSARWNLFIESVKKVSEYNNESDQYGKPSLARKLGHSMKSCAEMEYFECIKSRDTAKQKLMEAFLGRYSLDWDIGVGWKTYCHLEETVHDQPSPGETGHCQSGIEENSDTQPSLEENSGIEPSSKENTKSKPSLISLVKDVDCLNSTLESKAKNLCAEIENNPQKFYAELAKACLVQILLFNMRRNGDIQRMTVKDYSHAKTREVTLKKYLDDEAEGDMPKCALSVFEEKFCTSCLVVEVKLKNEPSEAILMTQKMVQYVDTILNFRENVGIADQPLLFARLDRPRHPYRGVDVLQEFANSSSLLHPDIILSDKLKNRVGIITQIVSDAASDQDVDEMFRSTDNTVEIEIASKVSKIWKHLQSTSEGKDSDIDLASLGLQPIDTLDDETDDADDADDESNTELQNKKKDSDHGSSLNSSITDNERGKRKTKAKGKHVWTAEEKDAINVEFAKHVQRQKVPGKDDVIIAQSRQPCLQKFQWKKIKFAVYNIIISQRSTHKESGCDKQLHDGNEREPPIEAVDKEPSNSTADLESPVPETRMRQTQKRTSASYQLTDSEDSDLDPNYKQPAVRQIDSDSLDSDTSVSRTKVKRRRTGCKKKKQWRPEEKSLLQPLVSSSVKTGKPPIKDDVKLVQKHSALKSLPWLKVKHQVWAMAQSEMKKRKIMKDLKV